MQRLSRWAVEEHRPEAGDRMMVVVIMLASEEGSWPLSWWVLVSLGFVGCPRKSAAPGYSSLQHRQPGKVKIFFVEDFVAEPDVALRGRSGQSFRASICGKLGFWGFGSQKTCLLKQLLLNPLDPKTLNPPRVLGRGSCCGAELSGPPRSRVFFAAARKPEIPKPDCPSV